MRRPIVYTLLVLGLILIGLSCMGALPAPIVFMVHLLIGWAAYLQRTLPNVQVNHEALIGAAACLAGVVVLTHLLGRWLYREMSTDLPERRRWRFGWTAGVVAVVVLMFVAGIAAVGIAHQSAWLAQSDRPMFTRARAATNLVRCASNMRQIGQALSVYAQDHDGQLPDRLESLLLKVDIRAEVFCCPATDSFRASGSTPEEQARNFGPENNDYVYHGRGLTLPLRPDLPILCEPLSNHFDGMNILFGDGRVEYVSPAEAERIMRRLDD